MNTILMQGFVDTIVKKADSEYQYAGAGTATGGIAGILAAAKGLLKYEQLNNTVIPTRYAIPTLVAGALAGGGVGHLLAGQIGRSKDIKRMLQEKKANIRITARYPKDVDRDEVTRAIKKNRTAVRSGLGAGTV